MRAIQSKILKGGSIGNYYRAYEAGTGSLD